MTERELFTITHSERQAFLGCQRKHHFSYEELLSSIRKAPALWVGTYVHVGLDAYYLMANGERMANSVIKGMGLPGQPDYLTITEHVINADIAQFKEDFPDMWPEDEERLEADKALVLAMLKGWPAFVQANDLDREFEIVATELQFEMRLPTPNGGPSHCTFRGKVDGVAKHTPTGNLFLMEHKTAKQVGDAYINQLQLDPQVPAYMAGIRECYGYETIGCIYNILRQQLPGPRVKAPLYYREWVWRNETEIAAQLDNLYWTYRWITRPGRTPVPNPSQMTCNGCAYRTLCLEDSIEARKNFTVKERKHSELS